MNKFVMGMSALLMAGFVNAQSAVIEGVIESASPIQSVEGEEGHPILGAAVGVGLGSLVGGGSGQDAAMIAGGLLGAKRQAEKHKEVVNGWQYVIKGKDNQLHSIKAWCEQPNIECTGIVQGTEVYIINGNQVSVK